MRSITSLPTLSGKRVLIRVDYNVPIAKNKIIDVRRIEASYQTIDAVLKKGGTPILLAHRGKGKDTLRPIATYLSKRYKIVFITADLSDKKTHDIVNQVPSKTVILFENIRRYPDEEKNTASFAKTLASYGQLYINDAFSVSHRAHASIVGIPKLLPGYVGVQLAAEIAALSGAVRNTKHPFLFILGGAKFSTKVPLLTHYIAQADHVVIAGAILNDFYNVAGFEIGKSVVEKGYDAPIKKLLTNPKLLLPVDVIVRRGTKSLAVTPLEIKKSDVVVDIGPQSIALIADHIKKAKLVVWNGPTGWYEKGYTDGTTKLAKAIAISNSKAIIGGGDTGAVIEGFKSKNIFVSTGGGATLEYLAKGTLPGIAVLE